MNDNTFDLAVIGGGPAGYVGALHAAKLGLKTVLFERDQLGGTCLNRGCIPTKTLLRSARILAEADLWAKLGVTGEKPGYDWSAMLKRKDEVVAQMRTGIAGLLKKAGITVIQAEAKLSPCVPEHPCSGQPPTILANGEAYTAKDILIAAGSSPLVPKIPGLESVWTSDDLLAGQFAQELYIIGGGVIGVEFASLMNTLGVKVTIIEALDRLIATVDKDISQNLALIFKKRGINVMLNTRATRELIPEGAAILMAIGRRGNAESVLDPSHSSQSSQSSQLPAIDRGQFLVDPYHQTSIPHVYAVGDVAKGDVQLAHAASAYAVQVVDQIATGSSPASLQPIPACIFTDPEIAVTGLTEAEAKAKRFEVKTAKYLMGGNGKTVVEIAERSFIKVVYEASTRRVLGAQLMCPHAAEMVNEFSLAIAKRLPIDDIAKTIHPHPTFGEGAMEVALNA